MTNDMAKYRGVLVELVANEFSSVVRGTLTEGELALVIQRNKSLPPDTCATHDFVDANMLMSRAMENVGLEPNVEDDTVQYIWSTAWSTATRREFFDFRRAAR